MRTLHWYLLRQVMATLVMTVAVFTFVLLLGNVLKEILALLVNRQVGLGTVLQIVLLLIPYVLVYALPMGFLTATLLVFGRLSADQELTAIRASGISLNALVAPVLLLSIACSALSAVTNLYVAPVCRMHSRTLLRETGFNRYMNFLPEKTYIRDFKNYIVYIDEADGTNVSQLQIYLLDETGALNSYFRAETGEIQLDRPNNLIRLRLKNLWSVEMTEQGRTPVWMEELTKTVEITGRPARRESVGDMTISQLFRELRELEAALGDAPALVRAPPGQSRRSGAGRAEDLTAPVKLHIHRQVSFSFACIGFTLVGIPLGIRAHRKETTIGIAIALMLAFVYYGFFIIGQSLETHSEWAPHLILWLPNIIFQAIGAVLFRRANRGF